MLRSSANQVETISELVARVRSLKNGGKRILIGITGEPGAGKSTIGETMTRHFADNAVLAGMDGFHLAQDELVRLDRVERKGAPDTFDSWGYLSLLKRLKARDEPIVYAPVFDRSLEEPIGSAVPISRDIEIIFTEGNYLLLDTGPWAEIKTVLDEVWYVAPSHEVRMKRLIDRHIAFGRSKEAAIERSEGSDEQNAALIRSHLAKADVLIRSDDLLNG